MGFGGLTKPSFGEMTWYFRGLEGVSSEGRTINYQEKGVGYTMRIKTIFLHNCFDILLLGAATSSWAFIEGGGDKLAFTRISGSGSVPSLPLGKTPFSSWNRDSSSF
jgi:hypothetical protein